MVQPSFPHYFIPVDPPESDMSSGAGTEAKEVILSLSFFQPTWQLFAPRTLMRAEFIPGVRGILQSLGRSISLDPRYDSPDGADRNPQNGRTLCLALARSQETLQSGNRLAAK
jgi:hypothetical protein